MSQVEQLPEEFRGVAFDTETTGLDPKNDRIIEFGAIEFDTRTNQPTGQFLHLYLNPQMPIPQDAVKVHGITDEMVANAPTFKEAMPEIVEFLKGAHLIAHNLAFDRRMTEAELKQANKVKRGEVPYLQKDEQDLQVLARSLECTLDLARRYSPAKGQKLDDICKRFDVSLEKRVNHGALLDAELLLMVYPFLKEAEMRQKARLREMLPFDPFQEQTRIYKGHPDFDPNHYLILEGSASYTAVDSMSMDDAASRFLQLSELSSLIEKLANPYRERVRELSGGKEVINDSYQVTYSDRTATDWKRFCAENAPEVDLQPYQTRSSALSIKYA